MTTFYLIRHGANDWLPKGLAGRTPGTHLNEEGKRQAVVLAEHLTESGIDVIKSSPLERALETAEPLAAALNKEIGIEEALLEINFGDWTGKTWEELKTLEGWKTYNLFRSGNGIPNGELIIEAQRRVVCLIERLNSEHNGKSIALVTHGDVIRAALTYYLGIPVDFFQRFEIAPASYSILKLFKEMPQVGCINRVIQSA